ncbi:hypothetical protein [Melghirimyces algeriensis]|uniref:hypothetical protein n=1 Tax=Melghirimyces algeriensis TaxID=910412 RepID=UPI00163D76CD|nr:hypothetical protein [Melghirimyces algeriensis]
MQIVYGKAEEKGARRQAKKGDRPPVVGRYLYKETVSLLWYLEIKKGIPFRRINP